MKNNIELLLIECSKINNFCDYTFKLLDSLSKNELNNTDIIRDNCFVLKNTIIFINESYSKNLIDEIQCKNFLEDLKNKLITLKGNIQDLLPIIQKQILSDLSIIFKVKEKDVKSLFLSIVEGINND